MQLIFLPITHAAPVDPKAAIEISLPVKKHLGLDDARSWIVIAEGNEFVWPGYDLRKAPKTDGYEFGFLPPRLFNQVRDAFVRFHKVGQTKQRPAREGLRCMIHPMTSVAARLVAVLNLA
jgi:hypothetical protein